MNQMLKQAQKMQEQMMKMQEELEAKTYEASAGGGAVNVKISGKKELMEITLSEAVVDPDDIEMLQDLIISAFNESIRKANEAMEKGMERAKGGLSIPGLF
jgi:DNA-binding YbaB/EbfC family protein